MGCHPDQTLPLAAFFSVFGDKRQLKKLEKESKRFVKLQQKEEKKQLKALAKTAKSKKKASTE